MEDEIRELIIELDTEAEADKWEWRVKRREERRAAALLLLLAARRSRLPHV